MLPQNKSDPVTKLIFELSKLPGIGERTATRLAYFILRQEETYAHALSDAIKNAKTSTLHCGVCFSMTSTNPCAICSNPNRDKKILCVVEKPSDVLSIEQTRWFHGRYHVLHGLLSPIEGFGPNELKIKELQERIVMSGDIQEIIVATNPSVEGDATAHYLKTILLPHKIRVSKLAHGIPVGGQLEFSDQQTIQRAFENRLVMV